MSDMSNGEIGRVLAELRTQLREGFEGLNDRVDDLTAQVRTTNGRVGTLETAGAVQGQKVANLEREIFRRRSDWQDGDKSRVRTADEGSRALTRRDLQIVLATLGTAAAVVTSALGLLKLFGWI